MPTETRRQAASDRGYQSELGEVISLRGGGDYGSTTQSPWQTAATTATMPLNQSRSETPQPHEEGGDQEV